MSDQVPILHGPPTEEEIKRKAEEDRLTADRLAEAAHKQRQINLNEASVTLTAANLKITWMLALFTALGTGAAMYQGYVANRSLKSAEIAANAAKSASDTASETLKELRYGQGAQDTHTLAEEAKTQAEQAKIQAKATESAAQTAQETLQVSQRAYITTGKPMLLVDAGVVDIPVINSGHIPSGKLKIIVHEATIDTSPSTPSGTVINPVERHWKHYDVGSIPVEMPFSIDTPVTGVVTDKIMSGGQQIFLAGSITYNDGFPHSPDQVWRFCNVSIFNVRKKEVEWEPCDPDLYIAQLSAGDQFPKDEWTY